MIPIENGKEPKRFSIEEHENQLRAELALIETELKERSERIKQLKALLKAADKAKSVKA